jgi:hypothetical protein
LAQSGSAWLDVFDVSSNIYTEFGFTLAELPDVIQALAPPPGFRTVGGHVFSGEEGVLLLLRRFRSTDPLMNLTKSCGRSISAISEAVQYMVEHIVTTFPHLVDERSFSSWAALSRAADHIGIIHGQRDAKVDAQFVWLLTAQRQQ